MDPALITGAIFQTNNTKFYVSVLTSSMTNNIKFAVNIKQGLKRNFLGRNIDLK